MPLLGQSKPRRDGVVLVVIAVDFVGQTLTLDWVPGEGRTEA